ncbi:MAG TPA: SMP-30/gluconolactonase/LRE family protein [Rubrivivax sp.]|nr:SMP-30/gluconolactonase/LRE family protein [Rubrivivax sp.]
MNPLPISPAEGPGVAFTPCARYPDPAVEVLHDSFLALRLYSAQVEQLVTGLRWAEGPQWFGDGRYLLFSDIPNNRILRWDECTGHTGIFRAPSNHANGLARDSMGRLLSCEHLTRRVTRTEYDGSITVLAERWQGRRLNSPNDIVGDRQGAVWFTDPLFGIAGHWEGEPADSETPWAVYRIAPEGGEPQRVIDDLAAPNGLAFSPDERLLYVVESRATPHRRIWQYDVGAGGQLSNKRLFVDAQGPGAYDGIAVDRRGNVWCGFGCSSGAQSAELDGVRVYDASGRAIGHVHLPERCANLCFGGPKHNRLFMAASRSLYALYVNVQGAA